METKNIQSLSRFFYQKENFPCLVAGRFFKRETGDYFLKSQGHSLAFKKNSSMLDELQSGSWLLVELLSKEIFKSERVYKVGDCEVLTVPDSPYKEAEFSYLKKGTVTQDWYRFLKAVEAFFIQQGLSYASTPHLVKCPGTEPYLSPLQTSFKKNYLATSPEMSLKKLLCEDWTDFFEIKTCFREDSISPSHQVEFTMLEWYRAFYSLPELMNETYQLIVFLQKQGFCKTFVPSAQFVSVAELFKQHLDFVLTPASTQKNLLDLAKKQDLILSSNMSFEDLFFLLFLNKIEPQLSNKTPVFIYDYPVSLRAFSKINQRNWADRFELYWKGLELANAFYEVTEPKEQKVLFEEHIQQRKDNVPLDQDLLICMKKGMPPVSGIALGLDRLFLALRGELDLRHVRLFSF